MAGSWAGQEQDTHREVQFGLLRRFFWLAALAAVALLTRDIAVGALRPPGVLFLVLTVGVLAWAMRPGAPIRTLAGIVLLSTGLLIFRAAWDLGGAAGPATCFSFIPGLLAMLLLGPIWGWAITALMLGCLAALFLSSPPLAGYDAIRFSNVVAMTVFSSGLGFSLSAALGKYERVVAARAQDLRGLVERRRVLTQAVYERLEPLAEELDQSLNQPEQPAPRVSELVSGMLEELRRVQAICRPQRIETELGVEPDLVIRRHAMQRWLLLAALFMAFFVARNVLEERPFWPSVFTLSFTAVCAFALRRQTSARNLEWLAFLIGVVPIVPMAIHIQQYGATPDSPPLVVMPATTLFTAVLSQGPACWTSFGLQVGMLAWVGLGQDLSLIQTKLLGNLAVCFLVVGLSVRSVLSQRRRLLARLLDDGREVLLELRRHRRLAGTLFHDVNNHLQVLLLSADAEGDSELRAHARSLGQRIVRLIGISKEFLVESGGSPVALQVVRVCDVLESLQEAYGLRLSAKGLTLVGDAGESVNVLAIPELLVESVLGNLLSNAIKFSPRGAKIVWSAESVGEEVCISLLDAGSGVPQPVLDRLSSDGPVPSGPGTEGEPGQGFGLQLVREHAARMHGRLELLTRAGGGTEARVWLRAGG